MRLHSVAAFWIATSPMRYAIAGVQLHPCPPQETLSPTPTEWNTTIPPGTLTPNTTIDCECHTTIPPETLSPTPTEWNTTIPPETLTPNTTIEWNATIPPETLSPTTTEWPIEWNTTDVCKFDHYDSLNVCLTSHNADQACHNCIEGAVDQLFQKAESCDSITTRTCNYLSDPACSCPIVECEPQLELYLECYKKSTYIWDNNVYTSCDASLDCCFDGCPAQDELQEAPCQSGFMCVLSNIIRSIIAWIISMFGGAA